MVHIKKLDEMVNLDAIGAGGKLSDIFKGLKENMSVSELRFAVCTKLEWKPASEGYSYIDKMMRFSFSINGSDIEYPRLDTYFECEKTGEDEYGDWVKPERLKVAILWTTQKSKTFIIGKPNRSIGESRRANVRGRINEMNVGKVDLEWDDARCDEFINNVEYKYLRMFTMFMNGEQFANYKYITPEGVQNLGNEIKMKNLNPSDVMCDILNKNTRGVEYRRILGIPDNANERYNYVGNSPHLCAIMMKYIITNILDANVR